MHLPMYLYFCMCNTNRAYRPNTSTLELHVHMPGASEAILKGGGGHGKSLTFSPSIFYLLSFNLIPESLTIYMALENS